MKRLARSHKVYTFDPQAPPALQVEPGEAIVVETTDSLDGQFDLSRPGFVAAGAMAREGRVDLERAMPMTGPLFVHGAEPGDVLVAEILGLVAVGNGFILPGFNQILEAAPPRLADRALVVELARGRIRLGVLLVPYGLMVGSLGLAPAGAPVDTLTPGDYGGNHDCRHLAQGARLYLQVQVPGALVSLGDVHAAMGDGEVAGTAVECAGEVTLRFRLHKAETVPGPVLETAAHWMVYGHDATTDGAIAMATERATHLLMARLGLAEAGAQMLLAAMGHVGLNEVVNPNRSARLEIAKEVVDPLLAFAAPEPAAGRAAVPGSGSPYARAHSRW